MTAPIPDSCAAQGRSRSGSVVPALRASWLLGVVVLVAWTQLFLGVHELKHFGQADSSSCKIALLASTVAGGSTQAAPALLPPAAFDALAALPVSTRELAAEAVTLQARAPPALA